MGKPHMKLFIPGPVEVGPETFAAMSQPMIGHRGTGFQDLYANIQPKLQADRKSTRLNSSHGYISYAVFCLKKKKTNIAALLSADLLTADPHLRRHERVAL